MYKKLKLTKKMMTLKKMKTITMDFSLIIQIKKKIVVIIHLIKENKSNQFLVLIKTMIVMMTMIIKMFKKKLPKDFLDSIKKNNKMKKPKKMKEKKIILLKILKRNKA